jgi:hypothetical protein
VELTGQQMQILRDAMAAYDYPSVVYSFRADRELNLPSMRDVESHITGALCSDDPEQIKDGLSNVLYWGYARSKGRQSDRVARFRNNVSREQLTMASQLFQEMSGPGVLKIKGLRLPQFSGMSFVSKIRMFLAPNDFVTLDLKLMANLMQAKTVNMFHEAPYRLGDTSIRVTRKSEAFYQGWCDACRSLAVRYIHPEGRAVDVERALFHLIGQERMRRRQRC